MFRQYMLNVTIDGLTYYPAVCSYIPADFVEGVLYILVNHPVKSSFCFMGIIFLCFLIYHSLSYGGRLYYD